MEAMRRYYYERKQQDNILLNKHIKMYECLVLAQYNYQNAKDLYAETYPNEVAPARNSFRL